MRKKGEKDEGCEAWRLELKCAKERGNKGKKLRGGAKGGGGGGEEID